MGGPEHLSDDEVAAVLARAAELDVAELEVGVSGAGGLDVATVAEIATEVGLPPAALDKALAELRDGTLPVPARSARAAPGPPDRGLLAQLGPPVVAVERPVPGRGADDARARVEAGLRRYPGLVRSAAADEGDVWVPRRGFVAEPAHGFDLEQQLRLDGVRAVKVTVRPERAGPRARIEADLRRYRRSLAAGAVAAPPAVVTAGSVVLGAAAGPGWVAGGLPVAVAVAAGGFAMARAAYRRRRAAVAETLSALADRLWSPTEERPPSRW